MELKQMKYLIAAIENKSLNKAAEILYTTQPNMSKVLRSLEEELNAQILIRSPKGITLTAFGEQVYEHAKNMIKNEDVIQELAQMACYEKLKIASYPSNMVARNLANYYMENKEEKLHIEFQEGTAEEVINMVYERQVHIGIIYIAKKQEQVLKRILDYRNLCFTPLKECELCLYVGPNHPYYNYESIDFEELKELRFVQGNKDYFSMVDQLETFSLGSVRTGELNHMVHTNSDHCMLDMLLYTDLCSMGLDFMNRHYDQYDIKTIKINNCEQCLLVGYVSRGWHTLEAYEKSYIKYLQQIF